MKCCPTLLLLISAGKQVAFTFAHSLRALETQEYFQIPSLLSDELCMTALSNGDVGVRSCDDNGDSQLWYYDDGTLVNKDTSKCADYDIINKKVVVWKCRGKSNQEWIEDDRKLRSGQDNKCMEVTDGGNIKVHECEDKPEQHFDLPFIDPGPDPFSYLIFNSGSCVSSIGGDENNAELQMCEHATFDGFQRWDFDLTSKSVGEVKNIDSGECLDVVDLNGDEPPMNVVTWKCNGNRNQQWRYDSDRLVFEIQSSSKKKYCLKAEHSGNLQADNCNGSDEQRFNSGMLKSPASHAPIRYDGEDTEAFECLEMGPRAPYNIFIAKCVESNDRQMWFVADDTKEIVNMYMVDDKKYCLDVRQSDLNMIAWPCHSSKSNNPRKNQQFAWDSISRIRSQTGLGCISINWRDKNIFLMECHSGDEQRFFWDR